MVQPGRHESVLWRSRRAQCQGELKNGCLSGTADEEPLPATRATRPLRVCFVPGLNQADSYVLPCTHVQRYYIWKQAQEVAHSSVWKDPRGYYFLNIMVVSPQVQGKGVGRAMMTHVTDLADAQDMPCYLESSRAEPNMAIYARFGFEFAKELLCDDDGTAIKLYTMVREPAVPSTA